MTVEVASEASSFKGGRLGNRRADRSGNGWHFEDVDDSG